LKCLRFFCLNFRLYIVRFRPSVCVRKAIKMLFCWRCWIIFFHSSALQQWENLSTVNCDSGIELEKNVSYDFKPRRDDLHRIFNSQIHSWIQFFDFDPMSFDARKKPGKMSRRFVGKSDEHSQKNSIFWWGKSWEILQHSRFNTREICDWTISAITE
jgi:hypothetical protein